MIGRVESTSISKFVLSCVKNEEAPSLGTLVAVKSTGNDIVLGVVTEVNRGGDLMARQVGSVEDPQEVYLNDVRDRSTTLVAVKVIGYRNKDGVSFNLPPRMPEMLGAVHACGTEEIRQVVGLDGAWKTGWMRHLQESPDEVIIQATLALTAELKDREQLDFLLEAGRRLVQIVCQDYGRMVSILTPLGARFNEAEKRVKAREGRA